MSDKIKEMYTNIDGIIPRKLELTDYPKQKGKNIISRNKTM